MRVLVLATVLLLLIPASAAAQEPTPSEISGPATATWTLRTSRGPLPLSYVVPGDLEVIVTETPTYLAITAGSDVAHTLENEDRVLPRARGVKVIDVSGATAHYSDGRPIGVDAASFLAGLAANTILDLEVGEVTETRLGARRALMADIRSRDIEAHRENGTLAHLDKEGDPGSGIIDLWQPSRLIVADVDEAILVVQVWAASEEDLGAWLPEAERLVASFAVGDDMATEPAG
jgi:hypothetical protein